MTNINLKEMRFQQYQSLLEFYRHYEELLFQRLYYFLVATTFLIAGFLTIVTNTDYFLLSKLILASGVFLSYGFAIINLLNAQVIWKIGDYICRIESEINDPENALSIIKPLTYFYETLVPQSRLTRQHFYLVFTLFFQIVFGKRPSENDKSKMIDSSPNTWIIPICFFFLWIGIGACTGIIYYVKLVFWLVHI